MFLKNKKSKCEIEKKVDEACNHLNEVQKESKSLLKELTLNNDEEVNSVRSESEREISETGS